MIFVRWFLKFLRKRNSVLEPEKQKEAILPLNIEHLQRNVEKEKFEK